MLAYIQDFTPSQVGEFWYPFNKPTTVCRMYICLENKGVEIFKVESSTKNVPGQQHAEEVAYDEIFGELFAKLNEHTEYLNNESQLDFAIAMNNSSCKGCRGKIVDWIEGIKQSIHGAHLQLILFFSNLYYVRDGKETSVDVVVVSFTNWVIDLVKKYDIFVDICPIIISKMLPKLDYKYRLKELSSVVKRDITCLKNFRKLLMRLNEVKGGAISVQSLQYNETSGLFDDEKPVNKIYLNIFTWETPQGISVRPIDKDSSPVSPSEPSTSLPEFSLLTLNKDALNTAGGKRKKGKQFSRSNNKKFGGKPKFFPRSNLPWYKKKRKKFPKQHTNLSKQNSVE